MWMRAAEEVLSVYCTVICASRGRVEGCVAGVDKRWNGVILSTLLQGG